jgi:23S rRNA (cytidine1920-2'-O)/16S rRNA (cytidine1409-2'-O)-methyltransferase
VVDVAWTKQRHILPAARRMVKPQGAVVTLVKPHYEADPRLLAQGVLPAERVDQVIQHVRKDIESAGFECLGIVDSPIAGGKGNREALAYLRPIKNL